MKILIVDDEPFNCFALQSLFKSLNLSNYETKVDYAYSGIEYLNYLKKSFHTVEGSTREVKEARRSKTSHFDLSVEIHNSNRPISLNSLMNQSSFV